MARCAMHTCGRPFMIPLRHPNRTTLAVHLGAKLVTTAAIVSTIASVGRRRNSLRIRFGQAETNLDLARKNAPQPVLRQHACVNQSTPLETRDTNSAPEKPKSLGFSPRD